MKKVYLSIQLVKLHHLQVLELRPILEDMSQVKHSFGDGPLVLLSDLPDITRYFLPPCGAVLRFTTSCLTLLLKFEVVVPYITSLRFLACTLVTFQSKLRPARVRYCPTAQAVVGLRRERSVGLMPMEREVVIRHSNLTFKEPWASMEYCLNGYAIC